MRRRSFLKALAGVFMAPQVASPATFSGTITGRVTGSIPAMTVPRVYWLPLVGSKGRVEIDATEEFFRPGEVVVRLVTENGHVVGEFTNAIYGLMPGCRGHLQLTNYDCPGPSCLPFDMPIDVANY